MVVGGLPEGWVWAELGEIATSVKNGMYVSRPGTEPNGTPILRIGAVRPMRLSLDDLRYTGLDWQEVQDQAGDVMPGDLLFTRYNGNPEYVGAGARVPDGAPELAYPDKLIRVRVSQQVMDSRFLVYAWASPRVREQVRGEVKTSAGQAGISGASLKRVRVPVPPLAEQHRIVEALEEQLSRLDVAVASTHSGRQRLPGLIGALRNTGIGSAAGRELPSGWHWGTIGQVLERIEAGKSFRCEARPALPHEWGVIKVSAMTWGEFREGEQKAVPVGREIDERYEVKPGDILVSRANTPKYVGAPVIVGDIRNKLLLSDKSLRLIPADGVDRGWLISVLSSPYVRRQISAQATGSKDSMRNISQRQLLEVEIPIAPKREQAGIAASVTASVDRAAVLGSELDRTLRRAEVLRSKILKKAFVGKLLPQDPADEPAATLLARIAAERGAVKPAKAKRAARPRKTAATAKATEAAAPDPTPAPITTVQQELFQ
ncbi:restriction endonuclease subunit S [Streptomyces sp. NRRL F-5755]|uniref:restriction endonuclease subunit S n=1 Tax=Streptomyces sp. NRRL F-5755 TaxID=1519475 RepID=UPI00099BFC60|nr:restriction endonuclease subunit S [Streptomyces sp. NRRL F-5755]